MKEIMNNIEAYRVITPKNFDIIQSVFMTGFKLVALMPDADMRVIKQGIVQELISKAKLTEKEAQALYDAEFITTDSFEESKEKKSPI